MSAGSAGRARTLTGTRTRTRLIALAVVGLAGAAALVALAQPSAPSVTVRWTTASEVDTAGFRVYRAEQAGGAWRMVTPHLLAAAPDPLVGGEHRFVDPDVVPGRTYRYEIEAVNTDGTTTRHGPVAVVVRSDWRPAILVAAVVLGLSAAAVAVRAR